MWLRRTLGQQLAVEAEVTRYYSEIPRHELKVEVKHNGRWIEVPDVSA